MLGLKKIRNRTIDIKKNNSDIIKRNPPFISSKKKMIKKLIFILKNRKKFKKKSDRFKKHYINKYSMKNITRRFINYII